MPLIVVDTSVALPAALKPQSVPRKLWVVLAYGSLTYQVDHLRLDREALQKLADEQGGEALGLATIDRMIESAATRRIALGELLPGGTPDDYVAVGFASLFKEFERKVREIGTRFDPQIHAEDARAARRQFEAICAVGAPPFDPASVPALTRDPEDDPIVYGALLAGCDVLVSDDKDIVPDRVEQEYEHAGHRLRAVRLGRFIDEVFEPTDFPWRQVQGAWLHQAFRR
jgi:predicted nucleic acid-binding protein